MAGHQCRGSRYRRQGTARERQGARLPSPRTQNALSPRTLRDRAAVRARLRDRTPRATWPRLTTLSTLAVVELMDLTDSLQTGSALFLDLDRTAQQRQQLAIVAESVVN